MPLRISSIATATVARDEGTKEGSRNNYRGTPPQTERDRRLMNKNRPSFKDDSEALNERQFSFFIQ